jgi:hypothetical protein
MLARMESTYGQRVADQLLVEIRSEMGRKGVRSSRALGRLIHQSSQYVSSRLDGGNPRTGERVPLTVRDLLDVANSLSLPASELLARAEAAVTVDPAGTDATAVLPTRLVDSGGVSARSGRAPSRSGARGAAGTSATRTAGRTGHG